MTCAHERDPRRPRPDRRPRGRIPGAGEPAAYPGDDRLAARRLRRGRYQRRQSRQAAGSAFQPMVSLAVAVICTTRASGSSCESSPGTRAAWSAADRARRPGHDRARYLHGACCCSAAVAGGANDRGHPGRLRAHGGGPAARLRPAQRAGPADPAWEGSLIDPVGAILGAVISTASCRAPPGHGAQLGQFLASIAVGAAGGAVGIGLLFLLLRVSGSARCSGPPPSWPR